MIMRASHALPTARLYVQDVSELLEGKYRVETVIGRGGSAVVLRARRESDNLPVAIKAVRVDDSVKGAEARRAAACEVSVLERTGQHPNMVKLLEVMEFESHIILVMEHIVGGDLFHRLKHVDRGFDEITALRITEAILESLVHLHSLNIAHRDVKLENVMFTSDNPGSAHVKLVDFGLAFCETDNTKEPSLCTRHCGTLQYCAPEVVSRRAYRPEEQDMWSLGVVLYTMISRRLPFFSSSRARMTQQITRGSASFDDRCWAAVSLRTQMLVRRLLSKTASNRPSAWNALESVRSILHELQCQQTERRMCVSGGFDLPKLVGVLLDVLQLRWLIHVA